MSGLTAFFVVFATAVLNASIELWSTVVGWCSAAWFAIILALSIALGLSVWAAQVIVRWLALLFKIWAADVRWVFTAAHIHASKIVREDGVEFTTEWLSGG